MRVNRSPIGLAMALCVLSTAPASGQRDAGQHITLDGRAGGPMFDGIGVVDGGGATSVLLKDYPDVQRSQILDLMYRPRFGASVSALYVEVPGDGNSTQGSMPSHMHTRDDLNFRRGYTWWIMREAKRRNPALTLDGAAWSAPGWIGTRGEVFREDGEEKTWIKDKFFSRDAIDYYVSWLKGLRANYGLEMNALGSRNEKGVSYAFAIALRQALDANKFSKVRLHGFDNWQDDWKFDFVKAMGEDPLLRGSLDVVSAHMNAPEYRVPADVQFSAKAMGKPIWNSEQHVYKGGFDGLISVVQSFNENFVESGVTKVVNWYGIAGLYAMEPYSGLKEAAIRASWPWSGHYEINPALWGYAHYGQFTKVGWKYLQGGSGRLGSGGTFVTLVSPHRDYSMIVETKTAAVRQTVVLRIGGGLSRASLSIWRSNLKAQFVRLPDVVPRHGLVRLTFDPASVYSITTTRGQHKGSFAQVPATAAFPLPYRETFDGYGEPSRWGYQPHFFADIAGSFELTPCRDRVGGCLRQAVETPPLSWAPNWQPYTIFGGEDWSNYEVAVDVSLAAGERAAVMGRINDVGTGYGYIPKGYMLELRADGTLALILSRGKADRSLVGDAEQQALIKGSSDRGPGGATVIAVSKPLALAVGGWHRLSLRFDGSSIAGSLDGRQALSAVDSTYARGMAGLLAGGDGRTWSRPFFDNVFVSSHGNASPAQVALKRSPLYGDLPGRTASK